MSKPMMSPSPSKFQQLAAFALSTALAFAGCGGTDEPNLNPGDPANPSDPGTIGNPSNPPGPTDKLVVGYFAAWGVYARNYQVTDIPADKLTHINYAFANLSADGECVLGDAYADTDKFYPGDTWDTGALRGSFHQLQVLKSKNPKLKTLISVGGWTWSTNFSDVAMTAAGRTKLAKSCVKFMKDYGFDGVDIDWEYPGGGGEAPGRPEDTNNFTSLLAALRSELDAVGKQDGKSYLLSIAAPAGPGNVSKLQLAQIHPLLDYINVMTYDFHGKWESATNFNSPLYAAGDDPSSDRNVLNTDAAIKSYLAGGVPSNKVIIGAAFYGHGWSGVPNQNKGLYQPSTAIPMGTWEAGTFDYHDLVANYIPTYTRTVHPQAKTPWLYSDKTGIMISYDDPESLALRGQYVNDNKLGGVMFWELSGDDAQHSLLTSLRNSLR